MAYSGLNTSSEPERIKDSETPDARNFIVDKYGNSDKERPGFIKNNTIPLGSAIYHMINYKSDDCSNDYNIGITAGGDVVVGIEDIIALPKKTNIVAYLKFEEVSGTLYDETANDNDGTYNGSSYRQPGKVGYCVGFDGAEQVSIAHSASLDITGDATLSVWFYPTPYSSDFPAIISKATGDTTSDHYWDLYIYDDNGSLNNTLYYDERKGDVPNYDYIEIANAYTVNAWNNVIVVADGTNRLVYINGVLADEKDFGWTKESINAPVWVGGLYNQTNVDNYYYGFIDEVIFWNTKLTATEIADYNNWNYVY